MDIFDLPVSFFANKDAVIPIKTVTLRQVLFNKKLQSLVQEFRANGCKPEDKLKLPCFSASGVISGMRNDKNLEHNGIMCIDLDFKDNLHITNFADLKKYIHVLPFVAYCGLSCGGKGFFLLVPIGHPAKHREHYRALAVQLRISMAEIMADTQCTNVSRLRFISYDPEPYINPNATVYTRLSIPDKPHRKMGRKNTEHTANVEKIIKAIVESEADITGNYGQWLSIGAALYDEFGEKGLDYFIAISQFSDTYKPEETEEKYTKQCSRFRKYNIDTFYHFAGLHGFFYREL